MEFGDKELFLWQGQNVMGEVLGEHTCLRGYEDL